VWASGRGQTDRQTDTDMRDHNTFRVVYDSLDYTADVREIILIVI